MDDKIAIRVDGGICSQINFIAAGMQVQELRPSDKVVYDLSWFKESGLDCDGKFVRNWDMTKAFPAMQIPLMSAEEAAIYRKEHRVSSNDVKTYTAPAYVSAYPMATEYLIRNINKFREEFKPELDEIRKTALEDMAQHTSCAVHVRRGDMAKGCGHGAPTTIQYYQKAVWIIRQLNPNVKFYFFSDEPKWVEEVLLPELPGIESAIVSGENESDKGYMDLYVIAKADYVISSIGTLGIYGAIFSTACKALIMSRKDDDVLRCLPHAICLNCNESVSATQMKKNGLYKIPYKIWKKLDRLLRA